MHIFNNVPFTFGLFSAFAGLLYTIAIIIRFFALHSAPEGWSSMMAVLLIMGGIILMVLGLIGEYVGRQYLCLNDAPQFVVREVVKKEDTEKK